MRLKFMLPAIVAVAGLVAASGASAVTNSYFLGYTPSGTQTLTINGSQVLRATDMGWYQNNGIGNGGTNYIVGNCTVGLCGDTQDFEYRDYFVFDLSGVKGPITSAVLSLGNPSNGFSGAPAIYTNWDVTTAIPTLTSGGGGLAAYGDLGSGVLFASNSVGVADNGTQVSITLDAAGLAAITAAEGGQFAIGGALANAVPEPAAWVMMLAGFSGLGAALRARRRPATA